MGGRIIRRMIQAHVWKAFDTWRQRTVAGRDTRAFRQESEAEIRRLVGKLVPLETEVGSLRLFKDAIAKHERSVFIRKGGGFVSLAKYIARLENKTAELAIQHALSEGSRTAVNRYGLGSAVDAIVDVGAGYEVEKGEVLTPGGSRASWNTRLHETKYGEIKPVIDLRFSYGDTGDRNSSESLSGDRATTPGRALDKFHNERKVRVTYDHDVKLRRSSPTTLSQYIQDDDSDNEQGIVRASRSFVREEAQPGLAPEATGRAGGTGQMGWKEHEVEEDDALSVTGSVASSTGSERVRLSSEAKKSVYF